MRVGGLLIAAGFLLANLLHPGSARENLPIRFAILPPPGTSLNSVLRAVAISRDGTRIALQRQQLGRPAAVSSRHEFGSAVPIADRKAP